MSNPRTIKRQPRAAAGRRSSRRLIMWIVALGLVGGLLFAGRFAFTRRPPAGPDSNQESPLSAHRRGAQARSSPAMPPDPAPVVADDGRALWVSPTAGPALDLAYLPPGVQVIVAVRTQELAAHSEGDKVRAALGPVGQRAVEYVERVGHVKWPDITRLVAGFQITSDGRWRATLVLETEQAARHSFAAGIGGAVEKRRGGESYWIAEERAYSLPARHHGRVLIVAPAEAIEDILDLAGETPPLRRDVERLLAHTDAERHVNVLLAPNALFSEGRRMFDGPLSGLREPLFWFLGDELSAVVVSMHWDEDFFVELLATPTLDTLPERTARVLQARVEQVPEQLEQYVAGLATVAYSAAVVRRFPAMMGQLATHTRGGFEQDRAVLRCYLPAVAGHNLLMGAELTLAERPGASRTVAEETAPSAAGPGPAGSVGERLERVISLRFARDTLEAALEQLAQDVSAPIVIRGPDLQAEGITKNQSFGIDLKNRRAKEILVEVLRLANPDKSASGPGDARQKLVYVISAAGPAGAEQIIVTTRAAAAERGEELPRVFRESGR